MQDVRTRIVVVVSKRRQVSAVSLWAYYFICKRQKCCLPDDFFFYLDFLKAMSNRHIYRILRVEAEVRLDQSCRTPNDNTHTHTHTHRKRIKSLIVVVSFSSIGLCFFFITFCLFLSFSYMILCVLPFLCCSFFCFRSPASSCFRYRNLFSGSPQGGESLSPRSQVYQAHVVRLIHRRIDPFADQHSRIEWICS